MMGRLIELERGKLWLLLAAVAGALVLGLVSQPAYAQEAATEEAAAAAVFATFFIGAYVLARCGEKLAQILLRRGP